MNDENLFIDFMKDLVLLTFGFTPLVEVKFPKEGQVVIILEGNDREKGYMMGEGAKNFHALKQLLRTFSVRHDCYMSYLYIQFKKRDDLNSDEQNS